MSPKTVLNRITLLLIAISAFTACTTSSEQQTPTVEPTPPAELTSATIPSTYKGITLPTPRPAEAGISQPPPAWLIVGNIAVQGSYGSFCYMLGAATCGDMPAPQDRSDIVTASLPADA